jgi:hypothetical protein
VVTTLTGGLVPVVLTDAEIYVAGGDLTGYSNKIEMAATCEDLDKTTFASNGWKERVGGVFDGSVAVDTFWQASATNDGSMPDDLFWASLGAFTTPITALDAGGAVGDLAYLTRSLQVKDAMAGEHGKLLVASAEFKTNWPVVRGRILHPQGTARATTGNGTSQQIGAVSTGFAMYVGLHVLSVADAAATLTVKVQSDNATGFPSPTDQATFTAASAIGGQTARILGPITDDWWRVTWTIAGGSSPSFLFAVSAGIGPK